MDLVRRARTVRVKQAARQAGFERVGVAPAERPPRFEAYLDALARGLHGEMAYLAREDAVAQRAEPRLLLPSARSIVAVASRYEAGGAPPGGSPWRGRIARYASGADYHDVLAQRLQPVVAEIRELGGAARVLVDGGPLNEVAHAARAGLGWIGKNTLLLDSTGGTWWLLAEVVCDLDLDCDEPLPDRCGSCTACLEACPTGAFPEPYRLDARRCLSYLTIELKGPIPRDLRPALGEWIFGCDVCQEVCPWSRRAARSAPAARAGPAAPDLRDLLALDDAGFRARFGGTPLARAKRRGLLRNVAVVLGNSGSPAAVPPLIAALADVEPLVRGHAAWALGRLGGPEAISALRSALAAETDPWVRDELQAALESP